MKTSVLIAILFLIAACNQAPEPKVEKETAEKITKDEALKLLHDWTDAYLNGNAGALNDVLDDSWVYSGSSDGSTSDKTATIEEFSNADYSFDEIKYHDLEVRVFNDIAVVRGWERMVILDSSKQDTTILKLRFTDVYEKKEGKVRAIATHSSPMD